MLVYFYYLKYDTENKSYDIVPKAGCNVDANENSNSLELNVSDYYFQALKLLLIEKNDRAHLAKNDVLIYRLLERIDALEDDIHLADNPDDIDKVLKDSYLLCLDCKRYLNNEG